MNNDIQLKNSSIEQVLSLKIDRKEAVKWAQKYAKPFRDLMVYYHCAMLEIETKLKVLNEDFSIDGSSNPIETIKTRIKSPESLFDKLSKKNLPITVESIDENINDVAGIRVICPFESDIYRISRCINKTR